MQIIRPNTNFDFVGKAKYAYMFSAALIAATIVSLVWHGGPRYGIDFSGGTMLQIKFASTVQVPAVKEGLAAVDLGNSTVQNFGQSTANEFLIRTDQPVETTDTFSKRLTESLNASTQSQAEIRRVEMVGPQVGRDLREKALLAIFYALLFVTIYISGRFEHSWWRSALIAASVMAVVYLLQFAGISISILTLAALIVSLVVFWYMHLKYAVGALIALVHDVVITVGFFSFFNLEFSLSVVAAVLTIAGYSLNDTIIVYDRIRENRKKHPKMPMGQTINLSVNETLSRTILTGGSALFAVLALYFLGGGIIEDFAFAMLVGIVTGTYSSIYVAAPILLAEPRLRLQR
jgi:preprotein translocase subunit SecF